MKRTVEKPRLGTVCLLLIAGAILWTVSYRLGSGPDDPDASRRSQNPPRGWAGPSFPPPPSSSETGSTNLVSLRVVDPSGTPLLGATVRAGEFEVCTDAQGRFLLPDDASSVSISLRGYFPLDAPDAEALHAKARAAVSTLDAGDSTQQAATLPPALVLYPGARLAGTVRDSAGRGVRNARVAIGSDLTSPSAVVTSNIGGHWTSPLLRPGSVSVFISHPDFRPAETNAVLSANGKESRADVSLEEGAPIEVIVRSRRGRPLANASVWLEVDNGAGATTRRFLGQTDDLGELYCHREPGKSARVRARVAAYREGSAEVPPATRRSRVEISLAPAPSLVAHAVDARDGLPVTPRGVHLEKLAEGAFHRTPHRGLLFASLTDGAIRAGLPPQPGRYRLVVHAERGLFGISPEVTFDGERSPEPVVVRLTHQPRLDGVVLSRDGSAIADAEVDLIGLDDGRVVLSTRSDGTGSFAFEGVPLESCRVAVRHAEFAERVSAPLVFPLPEDGGLVNIVLERGGTIRGVVRTVDGEASTDRTVRLVSGHSREREVGTNEKGEFVFAGVAPGDDYHVHVGPSTSPLSAGALALAPGSTGPLSVRADQETSCELRTTTVPAGSLEGTVLNEGESVACEFEVYRASSRSPVTRVRTDGSGGFFVRPLAAGSYRLVGENPPFVRTVNVVTGERARVEIRIETITWKVDLRCADDGQPLSSVARLRLVPKSSKHGVKAREVVTTDGHAEFAKLWPGIYELHVDAEGYVSTTRPVELEKSTRNSVRLESGKSVSVDLVESDGSRYEGTAEVTIRRGESTVYQATVNVAGTLQLPTLARGTYHVRVGLSGGREMRYSLTISPADTGK